MRARVIPAALGIAGLALALSACGGSSSSSSAPACDSATLLDVANASVTSEEDKASEIIEVQCDGDFAVGFATLGSGESRIEETDVFQAVDGAWTIVNRDTVCGTLDPNDPAKRPSDAQVPESIWTAACNTN